MIYLLFFLSGDFFSQRCMYPKSSIINNYGGISLETLADEKNENAIAFDAKIKQFELIYKDIQLDLAVNGEIPVDQQKLYIESLGEILESLTYLKEAIAQEGQAGLMYLNVKELQLTAKFMTLLGKFGDVESSRNIYQGLEKIWNKSTYTLEYAKAFAEVVAKEDKPSAIEALNKPLASMVFDQELFPRRILAKLLPHLQLRARMLNSADAYERYFDTCFINNYYPQEFLEVWMSYSRKVDKAGTTDEAAQWQNHRRDEFYIAFSGGILANIPDSSRRMSEAISTFQTNLDSEATSQSRFQTLDDHQIHEGQLDHRFKCYDFDTVNGNLQEILANSDIHTKN